MASTASVGDAGPTLLSKERIIAKPGFNRWLVPPAALCIHLCIGMAYGFSVFWKPLQGALLGADGKALPECSQGAVTFAEKSLGTLTALTATDCNWSQFDLGWMYTFFFVLLGVSAAIWGGWLERVGPRKAAFVSALCWCGGLLLAAVGVYVHQLWLMWIGAGVIGGIGLGLGYISPVSTLIKWFPDRRGMATGMAIMGFGGGAMIGSPLATILMNGFKDGAYSAGGFTLPWAGFRTATDVGVWQTFVALAGIYFVFMMIGAFGYRLPPAGWKPQGWTPPANGNRMITSNNVHLKDAHKTPQFWLLWLILCMNVSAGIGIIGAASPMLQETFGGALVEQSGARLPRSEEGRRARRRCRQRRSRLRRAHLAVQHLRPYRLGLVLRPARAQDRPTSSSSYSAPPCTCWPRSPQIGRSSRCSSPASASSLRCTVAASPPSPPISPTCSARSSSAPFTDACSRRGRRPASLAR